MTTLTTHVSTLWAGESNPPVNPDQNLIEQRVAQIYHFLLQPLRVTVDEERVTIHSPSPTRAQVEQSERLAFKAGGHASAGRNEQAIRLFERAARLNPANHHIYQDLGMVQQQLGKLIAARDCFIRALRLSPADVATMVAAASLALHGFKDVAMAEGIARDACALQPYNPFAVNALATTLVHAERWDEAVPLFA